MEDQENQQILEEYAETQRQIRNILAAIVAGGIITYAELQKQNKYKPLLKKVNAEIGELNVKISSIIRNGTKVMYTESYYQSAYMIDKMVKGVNISFNLINSKIIQAAMDNPLSNLAIAKSDELLKIGINQAITQSFIQGEGFPKMAKRVSQAMGEKAKNVMTIARTEGHTAVNKGKMDAAYEAENQGVKMVKVWDSTLDSRTRPEHGAMDGQKRKIDEKFSNGLMFPGDPAGGAYWVINCRCAMRQEIDGYSPKVRRVDGEVTGYKTYTEWLEGRK